MTVSTEVNENTYTGNGTTTVFPYQFRIFSKSDLVVQVSDLNENVTTLTLDTNYTVSGAGGYRGGNVTLMAPLASGWRISIARELEITQDTDLRNQGKFFAETHEDVFDRLTMLIQQVYRRFGLALRKPSSIAGYYDALGNKIRNLGNPTQAQDAATKDYVDSNLNRTLRVPESFIPELPGAPDRANRLHGYDSLGNPAMLLPESGSAADVLLNLADYSLNKGDKLVAMKQPATGAKPRTVHDKLAEVYSVLDFDGVVGDGFNDDSDGIQKAVDAVPVGGVLIFPTPSVYYKLTKEIKISRTIKIEGNTGSTVAKGQMPCIKVTGSFNAFKLVPTTQGYLFEPGYTGSVFRDIMIEGPSNESRGKYGFCMDETVNAGIYHVRELTFDNVHIRYFDRGWSINGICYLNNWISCRALWCGVGCRVDKVPGSTQGGSDQNRFFGCEIVLCDRGLNLSEDSYAGSQSVIGCTISEGLVGIIAGFNTTLYVAGCQIENNQYSGLNISIPSSVGNPNSEACKTIVGNSFILNGNDIALDKQTTAFAGGFAWPMLVAGNSFSQTKQSVLYINAPTGPKEFDSRQFRLCSSNSFSPVPGSSFIVGPIPDGMISDGWRGYNGYHEDGKVTLNATVLNTIPKNVMRFTVPAGKGCYIKYTISSIPETAAGGTSSALAGIRFTNAGTAGTIKEDLGREGTLVIPRQNNSLDIVVALWSNSATNVGVAEVNYCIM